MADAPSTEAKNQMTPQGIARPRVEILECTLRDGSYAVDFKFTENDTAVLAGVLGRLGFCIAAVTAKYRFVPAEFLHRGAAPAALHPPVPEVEKA